MLLLKLGMASEYLHAYCTVHTEQNNVKQSKAHRTIQYIQYIHACTNINIYANDRTQLFTWGGTMFGKLGRDTTKKDKNGPFKVVGALAGKKVRYEHVSLCVPVCVCVCLCVRECTVFITVGFVLLYIPLPCRSLYVYA